MFSHTFVTSGPNSQSVGQPQILARADGSAVILWVGSDRVAYGQVLSPSGHLIGSAIALSDTNTATLPEGSIRPDGGLTIAWTTADSGVENGTFVWAFDANLVPVAASERIYPAGNGSHVPLGSVPRPDGSTVVFYQQVENGQVSIYAQAIDSDGQIIGNRVLQDNFRSLTTAELEPDGTILTFGTDSSGYSRIVRWSADLSKQHVALEGGYGIQIADAAVLPNGNFVFGGHTNSSGNWNPTIFQYQSNGSVITYDLVLSGSGYDEIFQSITVLPNGNYAVAWQKNIGGSDSDLYYQIMSSSGSPIGVPVQFGFPAQGYQYTADLGIVAGTLYGVFVDSDGKTSSIQGEILANLPSAKISSIFSENATSISIAQMNDGRFSAVWEINNHSNGSGTDLVASILNSNGQVVGSPFFVNSERSGDQFDPVTVSLDSGGFAVVWADNSTGKRLLLQEYDSNGFAIGAERILTTGGPNLSYRPDVARLSNGEIVVTWADTAPGSNGDPASLLSVSLSPDLTFQSDVRVLSTGLSPFNHYNSSVTPLSDGGYAVTFDVGSSGYYRVIDSNHTPLTPAISVGSNNAYWLRAAEMADGSLAIAWMTIDSGIQDVFLQRWSVAGAALSSVQQVNVKTSDRQGYPEIVTTSDGGVAIVFRSDAPILTPIIRAFDSNLQPITGEIILPEAGSSGTGKVDIVDTSDGLLIAFTQTNSGLNSGVYTVSFSPPAPPSNLALLPADDSGIVGDSITNDATPRIAGSAEPGAVVSLTSGATLLGKATATSNGTWTIEGSTALTDGVHTVVASAPGSTKATASLTFTIDTHAPTAPTLALDTASDTGVSASDGLTADATPTLIGTGEAGATAKIYAGASLLGTAPVAGDGSWTFTTAALPEGTHALTAQVADAAGNVSVVSSTLSVTIDTTAPMVAAPMLATGDDTGWSSSDGITSHTSLTIAGSTEADSAVELTSNGATLATTLATASAFTVSTTLVEGTHTVAFVATDRAGNKATSAATTIIVDTTAPVAPGAPQLDASSDTGRSATDGVTRITTPTVVGTAEAGTKVTVTVGGITLAAATVEGFGSWSATSGALGEGSYATSAVAEDAAGNRSTVTTGLQVVVDTTPPTLSTYTLDTASDTGLSATDQITKDTTPTVIATTEAEATLIVTVGAVASAPTVADAKGFASATLASLPEGTHVLTATAEDLAGNSSAAQDLVITIDTTAPGRPSWVAQTTVVTGTTTASTTATAQSAGSAEISFLLGGVTTATAAADGTGVATATIAIAGKVQTLTAIGVDLAGNASTASTGLTLYPPGATVVIPPSTLGGLISGGGSGGGGGGGSSAPSPSPTPSPPPVPAPGPGSGGASPGGPTGGASPGGSGRPVQGNAGPDTLHDTPGDTILTGDPAPTPWRLPRSDAVGPIAPGQTSRDGDWFDPDQYRTANPDVVAAGIDPWAHFFAYGLGEGRAWSATRTAFDPAFYRANYLEGTTTTLSPWQHYLQVGAAAGFAPSPAFDGRAYLAANPDVAASGTNPLLHFLRFGLMEGRGAVSVGTADRFVLAGGRDRITDFNPAVDQLVIPAQLANGLDAATLLASATVIEGNTVISFGAGHSVTLVGIAAGNLRTGIIVVE